MSYITLKMAKEHLDAWLKAELAVSTGQQHSIGSLSLTRASIGEIRRQIQYWKSEIAKLEGKGRRKVQRVMPRDL